jgi:outer membrane immunogenic protein
MRKLACLVGLFVLASLPAVAQETGSKDVSVEYSYLRANPSSTGFPSFNANGGSASFAYNPRSSFGLMGEFSAYHIGDIGSASVNTNLYTYMFGPQFYFHHYSRFTPFVQDLFGVAHTNAFGATHNSFAMAVGGGVDVPFRGHLSLRLGPVDYLLSEFPEGGISRRAQNNLRVSGGVRYRF